MKLASMKKLFRLFFFLSDFAMDHKILCFILVTIPGLGLAFGEQNITFLPLFSYVRIIHIFTDV